MRIILIISIVLYHLSVVAQPDLQKVCNLTDELEETSALVVYNKKLWTINDSGGEPRVYAFNKKGTIIHRVDIKDAENRDWEALAVSNKHLLIGDFGNNFGIRKDLTIYAIELQDLHKNNADVRFKIEYTYPEQKSWIRNPMKTPYDCEAMLVYNNQIHIFTKNWKDKTSTHYTLPYKPGKFEAREVNLLEVDGLVTDATIANNSIWFIGYYNKQTLLWKYNLRNKTIHKTKIPVSKQMQTEGIAIQNDTLFITTEKSDVDEALYHIPLTEIE